MYSNINDSVQTKKAASQHGKQPFFAYHTFPAEGREAQSSGFVEI